MNAQEVINLARQVLNDDAKVRYTDAQCLAYLQTGHDELRDMRPDLFIGNLKDALATLALGSTIALPAKHLQQLADYVAARCLAREDEVQGESSKAALMFTLAGRK